MAIPRAQNAGRRARSDRAGASATVDGLAPGDAVLREFIADFSAASALMRRLRRSLADALGLSVTAHSVMLALWYCERRGETTVRDLADHLHVAAANVTAELGRLERAGFVSKTPSTADKRAVVVQLTQKGHQVLNRLAPLLREVNVELFAGVHFSDMVVVHQFFKRVINQAPEAIMVAERLSSRAKD